MSRRRLALLLAALALALAAATAGCRRHCWYEWRDEPYIRPVFLKGEAAALGRMRSMWVDDRDIGARALGDLAREARAAGDEASARRMARVLMAHFDSERDPLVRATILAVSLREAGEGDGEVHAFLKSRVGGGGHPAAAAYGLAALRPPGAFEAIAAALRSAREPELRRELLNALWMLGDRRAIPLLEAELEALGPEPPGDSRGRAADERRRALAGRLRTLRAACRAEAGE